MTASDMRAQVEDFLSMRAALGFNVENHGWLLRDFARYAKRVGHRGPVTIDLAVRWAISPCEGDAARGERRLGAIRQFARHRLTFEPGTAIPPVGLIGRIPRRRPPPHIYSEAEVAALIKECGRLRPQEGLRPKTYRAFFSLLVSTGLRLSEARRLERRDVDLAEGLLLIRESKFRKSRFVPLHVSAVQGLARYAAARDAQGGLPPSDFFFCTERSPALGRAAVQKTFSRMRERLHWSSSARTRSPRIHDLRHTFAVRRLVRWYEEGVDVNRKILALATYLGHAKITEMYWYLSAVPELLAIPSASFEHFASREGEVAP